MPAPRATAFVAMARSQIGDRYRWGAEARPDEENPPAFDCSELVQWALARIGLPWVDGSINQYGACRRAGTLVSVAEAIRTPGALLFRIGTRPNHVAISTGDGSTVEARGVEYGVGTWTAATTARHWTHAGLVPGIDYTRRLPVAPLRLQKPVVTIMARPQGDGYWLVTADGWVITFGEGVPFHGSLGNVQLVEPIVDGLVSPSGNGYALVAADGGVFCFGDFVFRGSVPAHNAEAEG